MLTEMKQTELRLLSQDLWGISKSISDSISRPEILVDDYLDTHAEKFSVSLSRVAKAICLKSSICNKKTDP